MRILQKKDTQIREQGRKVGREYYLKAGERRIGKPEKQHLQLADARAVRTWEHLSGAKKERLLRRAGAERMVERDIPRTAFAESSARAENNETVRTKETLETGQPPEGNGRLYQTGKIRIRPEGQRVIRPRKVAAFEESRSQKDIPKQKYENVRDQENVIAQENARVQEPTRILQNNGSQGTERENSQDSSQDIYEENRKKAYPEGKEIREEPQEVHPQAIRQCEPEQDSQDFDHTEQIKGSHEDKKENARYTGDSTDRGMKRRITRKLGRRITAMGGGTSESGSIQAGAGYESGQESMFGDGQPAKNVLDGFLKAAGSALLALVYACPVFGVILAFVFLLSVLLAAIAGTMQSQQTVRAVNLSAEGEEYRSTVREAAGRYGMTEYVELILAVMMTESGGRGNDPMQASEGAFNTRYPHTPNAIQDPAYSIECGIQELKNALNIAAVSGSTDLAHIRIALQGYNFGPGYISWMQRKGYGEWSFETACEFAEGTGWGRRSNPNHVAGPWRYGDQYYPEHVLRYYSIQQSNAALPGGGLSIPLYYQWEYQEAYGRGTIAQYGCGPSSFAMVVSYLKNETITPADVVAWCGNDYYVPGAGTSWSFFAAAAEHYNIGSVTTTTSSQEVIQALQEGRPVISSQSAGLFTRGGHYIVLRGVTLEGKILVNDPNDNDRKQYASREFDMSTEINSTSRCYWIFESRE